MIKNSKSLGFTLIEVLIVVAIIGILASVVVGQLTTARGKAANAAIKSSMSTLRTQANVVYSNNTPNTYDNVCTDPIVVEALTSIGTIGQVPAICFDSPTAWVIKANLQLPEDTTTNWCTDSTLKSVGMTGTEYDAITGTSTLCP